MTKFAMALAVLVLGAGAEELLPKVFGVGGPILLSACIFASARRGMVDGCLFAIAAGAMEDALCSLPAMTSPSCFLVFSLVARWGVMSRVMMIMAYPCYQAWLAIWVSGIAADFFVRALVSLPIGVVTVAAVGLVLAVVERRAAIGEEG